MVPRAPTVAQIASGHSRLVQPVLLRLSARGLVVRRPLSDVPRRAINAAVILGGIAGIVLQARFGWDALTTFLITLGLCALSVALITLLVRLR